ncbi:MAG: RNA chaperone Hfq [Acidobacteriia bacterium]|nr:RNA chaperone Hfq [Terriglobia bacterium]
MEKQPQNIQDGFLNSARKEKILVTVYLLSGVKLTGRIRSFDKYSVILESNSQEQMVFKHAIATVVLPRASNAPPPPPAAAASEG